MSMRPFFPSLKPHTANHIWFEIDINEDENEVTAIEKENNAWINKVTNFGSELNPLGRIVTMAGQETDDDEDGNDDTDSDSHDDEEDDEIDRLIVDSVNSNRPQMPDAPYSPAPEELIANLDGSLRSPHSAF